MHRFDAAHLFRLAVEKAPAGSTLHAIADEGVPIRAIAEVIGRHLGLPAASVVPEDAAGHFGWLGAFLALDSPASSALTRELLGWQPAQPGLLDDLDKGHYFHQARPGTRRLLGLVVVRLPLTPVGRAPAARFPPAGHPERAFRVGRRADDPVDAVLHLVDQVGLAEGRVAGDVGDPSLDWPAWSSSTSH